MHYVALRLYYTFWLAQLLGSIHHLGGGEDDMMMPVSFFSLLYPIHV